MIDKIDCSGCIDDVYNHGYRGMYECLKFHDAVLVPQYVIFNSRLPPFDKSLIMEVPDCYQLSNHSVVSTDKIDESGYWKRMGEEIV